MKYPQIKIFTVTIDEGLNKLQNNVNTWLKRITLPYHTYKIHVTHTEKNVIMTIEYVAGEAEE